MKYNIIGDIHGRDTWKRLVREDAINIFLPFLLFALAIINYRGAQYELESDTWWGAANELQSSWREMTQPVMVCDSVPVITDRLGRTYCYNEWHYYDRHGNLHFNLSRLIVLAVWYLYIFIGPWMMLWLIYKHSKS